MDKEKELAMTKPQYDKVMNEVWKNHRFSRSSYEHTKHIKYVRPNWDMRDGMCFSITFDGIINKEFKSGHGETLPMFDRIMTWLREPVQIRRGDTYNA